MDLNNNPENNNRLPTQTDIQAAISRNAPEVAKEMWEQVLQENEEAAMDMAKIGQPKLVELGLQVVSNGDFEEDLQVDFMLNAMQNPNADVILTASGMMKQSGLHLGLMREFALEKNLEQKKMIARSIALTQPQLPDNVAAFLQDNPDPIAAAAGTEQLGEVVTGEVLSDAKLQTLRRGLDAEDYDSLREYHSGNVRRMEQDVLRRQLGKNLSLKGRDLEAAVTRYGTLLERNNVTVADLYRDPVISQEDLLVSESARPAEQRISPEEIQVLRQLGTTIQDEREAYNAIVQEEIMETLLLLNDKGYYREYIEAAGDKTITQAERNRRKLVILRLAVYSGGRMDERTRALSIKLNSESRIAARKTAEAAEKKPLSSVVKKAATAAVVLAVVTNSREDQTENSEVANLLEDVNPDMKAALQQSSTDPVERPDGSVEVTVEGQSVVFDVRSGKLTAFVEANDGTRFYLDELSVADLEAKTIFGPVQYNLNRSLWSGDKYTDGQILESVYGLNVSDAKIDPVSKRRIFTQQLKGLPNDRQAVIELYQALGVLGADLRVDKLQGLKVASLYAYLDARIGLEHVKKDDIEAIATVWKQAKAAGKPADLMTPQTAHSILENQA